MFALAKVIVTLYEENNLGPSEIAEELKGEYDIAAIKATLLQFSTKYRKDAKKDANLDFDEQQQLRAKEGMLNLMEDTEDENLKFRIQKYVRNDAKGRLDVMRDFAKLQVNTLEFNERLARARLAKEATYNNGTPTKEATPCPGPAAPLEIEAEIISK